MFFISVASDLDDLSRSRCSQKRPPPGSPLLLAGGSACVGLVTALPATPALPQLTNDADELLAERDIAPAPYVASETGGVVGE